VLIALAAAGQAANAQFVVCSSSDGYVSWTCRYCSICWGSLTGKDNHLPQNHATKQWILLKQQYKNSSLKQSVSHYGYLLLAKALFDVYFFAQSF